MSYPDMRPELWPGGVPDTADGSPSGKEADAKEARIRVTNEAILEAGRKRKKEQEEREEAERQANRQAFVNEAIAYGFSEKQLEFLEKYFERKGHEHCKPVGEDPKTQ